MGGSLVLRSHECDHPPGVEELPWATEPRLAPPGSSAGIDAQLRDLLEEGLGVFRVDAEALREAAPQVILTQDQCAVCAIPRWVIDQAVAELLDPPPEVVSVSPTTVEEILASVATVARALGVPERGIRLRRELAERLARVGGGHRGGRQGGHRGSPGADGERPSVLTIEWFDPLMPAGNWVPELVELAGGRNLLGEAGAHSPTLSWEEMAATDPDVVVLLPCGFGIQQALAELPVLEALPGWRELRAVGLGRVAVADGNRYFNRPGPRVVESAEILAEILRAVARPGLPPGPHQGDGWRWVPGPEAAP
jgi:iron complex transport system substrate-binding protein